MIIAVNTRLLLKNKLEGIGWFTHECLKRITQSHPEHTFLFLFDRPFDREFIYSDNIIPIVVPPPARHPILWYAWLENSLPRVIRKYKAELYVSTDGFMPLRLSIPSIITIHDINFHHRPLDLPLFSRAYYRKYFPLFASHSKRITTVSEYSRMDLVNNYGVDPEKIDVVYNGVNEVFSPLDPTEAEKIRGSLTGGIPYFVYVGSMHPRKNLSNLLRAFDLFRLKSGRDHKLVLVGEKMFMTGNLEKTFESMKHRKDVIYTGRLAPLKLRDVIGASLGMTFLPFFEGFGIPLLEAMRCEIPILASNVSSLPEVAADAAIFADPAHVEDIAEGMMQLSTDVGLRSRLVQAGKKRGESFSWDITANHLWNSIERVIDQC